MNQKQLQILNNPKVQELINALDAIPVQSQQNQKQLHQISTRIEKWMHEFSQPKIQHSPHIFNPQEIISQYITKMRELHGPQWSPF